MPTSTSPATCRECGGAVQPTDAVCAQCDAVRPAIHDWKGEGFEWKSRGTWMGYPLVHIAFGCDRGGRPRTAEGIVAIGQRAVGVLACGILSAGVFSVGLLSVGVVSLGVVSVALGLAAGVNAVGPCAFGVTAIGFYVGGLAPFGWEVLFSPSPAAK